MFASGKLTSNGNELQKVCQELIVDENSCESFVEHQEFLAMKAQKRASERNTVPNIDWNNEDRVSSLTAHKLRLYLKQHNLQVSWEKGKKATLVASVPRYVRVAQHLREPEDNDATSDSELQSSDSEDPDDSEDDAQPDSSEMSDFIEHIYEVLFVPDTNVECVTKQCRMSIAVQSK